jgi:hypothetical protein
MAVEWVKRGNITASAFIPFDVSAMSGEASRFRTRSKDMKRNATFSLLILACWLPTCVRAQQLWSNIIDPSRAINWTGAGVIGGIPSASWPNCTSAQASVTVPIAAYGSMASPGNPSTINNALTACAKANPSGSVLQLGPGTFYLRPTINFGTNSSVVLRGQGANQTTIYPVTQVDSCGGIWAIVCIQGSNAYIQISGSEQNVCDWTSGYSSGSATITLANCGTTTPAVGSLSNLKIGSLLVLDQLAEQNDTGNIWNCQVNYQEATGPAGLCSSEGGSYRADGTCVAATLAGWSGNWCVREQEQIVRVTNCTNTAGVCTSSANITIDPPIYMPNWNSAKLPQAWYANYYLSNDGVENLTVTTGDVASGSLSTTGAKPVNIALYDCFNCWIKGVASLWADRSHFHMNQCQHCEARDSYLYQNIGHYTQSYGAEWLTTGNSKFENNIGHGITDGIPMNTLGGEGNVDDYNYVVDTLYTASNQWMQQGFYEHDSGDAFNLYEGNIGSGINADDVHGTHHFMTWYRSYLTGWQTACPTGCGLQTFAFKIQAGSRFYNLIGNVAGTAGYHTQYECISQVTSNCTFGQNIFELSYAELASEAGFCTTSSCSALVSTGYDPITLQSMMLWGNYDTVTGAVRWCGNSSDTGWASICGRSTEVYSASFSPYGSAVPTLGDTGAGQGALPASFLYSSKPSWWGSNHWPAIGPDVTGGNVGVCSGGTYGMLPASTNAQCAAGGGSLVAGLSGHVNMIPAMNCYLTVMGGPLDGGGVNSTTPLAFNASACYSGSGSLTVTTPTVMTTTATSITSTGANSGGTATNNGGASVTAEGVCYGTSPNPTSTCTSNGTSTPFTSVLASLSPGTLYYYQAYSTNSVGTAYGGEGYSFTTSGGGNGSGTLPSPPAPPTISAK